MSLFPTKAERILTQMAQADAILDKLFPIDTYAICAGGAPRDWYFGNVAADLDFFIYSSINTTQVARQLAAVGIEVGRAQHGDGLPDVYKKNPNLTCVFSGVYNGTKIQIMVMHEPTFRSVVPEFPLSICKAWYKNYKIHLDKDFKRSVLHNVIVKTNTIYDSKHPYLEKVLAKFPDLQYYEDWDNAAKSLLDKELV